MRRAQKRIGLLVAMWTWLWMVLAAPCAVAGHPGSGGPDTLAPAAGSHASGHMAPGGEGGTAAELLCYHSCNQLALAQDLRADPSPASHALPAPDDSVRLAASAFVSVPVARDRGPPYPDPPAYLLNESFLN